MVVFTLRLKEPPTVPVDARRIKPDKLAGKTLDGILNTKLREGSRVVRLRDLFEVTGPEKAPESPGEIEIVIEGEGSEKLRYLGYKMTAGKIIVKGNIGGMAGYKMKGGTIVIEGDAASWLGAKMKDGLIEVHGDAGDFVGSKLQGEKPGKGMKGGMIVIHGNAGSNIGAGMGGGAIIVEGDAGDLVGAHMTGGSILVCGKAGRFTGARMTGGKIIVSGLIDGILPSFYVDSIVSSAKVKSYKFKKPFMMFIGDVLVNGMGKLFVALNENRELLKHYEELLEDVVI